MKTISSALASHITGGALTMCTCWRIQRPDGQSFRFTDHDADIMVGGELYEADSGFTRSAVEGDDTLAAPNLQIVGLVQAINASDLINGLWDYSEVKIFLVNWTSPDSGQIKLRHGFLGEITTDDSGEFQAELRGLAQLLGNNVGELYTPECRADLGDARCKVDLTPLTGHGVCGAGSSKTAFVATGLSQPASYYDGGTMQMTTGVNVGVRREVLTWDGTTLTLFLPLPQSVTVGDAFTVTPGCDKQLKTCIDKFNNVLNYRGEPTVPGSDALLQYQIPAQPAG